MAQLRPGDIVCSRTSKGLAGRLIRLGAAIMDKPNTVNHVIVVSHRDAAGTLWGIEARPGGVGYRDMGTVVHSAWSLDNIAQTKTTAQRKQIVEAAKGMLGTPYDWEGIAADAMEAIGAQALWCQFDRDGTAPAHVVCSSLADWVYDKVGLESPGKHFDRECSPGDWAEFITLHGFHRDITSA